MEMRKFARDVIQEIQGNGFVRNMHGILTLQSL